MKIKFQNKIKINQKLQLMNLTKNILFNLIIMIYNNKQIKFIKNLLKLKSYIKN